MTEEQQQPKLIRSINPGDSLRELVSGKKEVIRVQRAINYHLSPLYGLIKYVRRHTLPLVDLLMRQSDLVGHMGICVAQMAETCKEDQLNLFQYLHELDGRVADHTARSSTLADDLTSRLARSRDGEGKTIAELEEAIKTLEIRYDCRNIGIMISDAQHYSAETRKLLESTTQMYKDLEGIAHRFCGVGVHLNRISLVLAHKIQIGAQSKALHDVFATIRQNNDRAGVEVDRGVQYVRSLLNGVSLPALTSESSATALTPALYLQQSIKSPETSARDD